VKECEPEPELPGQHVQEEQREEPEGSRRVPAEIRQGRLTGC
jgi:hypothetical protein